MPGATISPTGDIFDLKIDEFQKVLDLNLTGTILPTQVFLKPMVEQRAGAIVNFSSMAAFRPLTRVAGYAAAKAGISNFTAFMATEIAKKFGEGIRINAIAPGFVRTDMTADIDEAELRKQIPAGRFCEPAEVADLAMFLISEQASYITGEVISINGGLYT
jgi:NAD(P)-dependent dehydrogenase (short-subunit alcohol dehydrogenase family)